MMIGIATHTDDIYPSICNFASIVYARKLHAILSASPDVFAYASAGSTTCGCFGLYLAETKKLLLESYFESALSKLTGCDAPVRAACAELGTRAIERSSTFSSKTISVALCARLLMYAHSRGVRYFGFTANRTSLHITKELGLETSCLGRPDLSGMTDPFKENWSRFFKIDQYCFGFRLDSTEPCASKLKELESAGLVFS